MSDAEKPEMNFSDSEAIEFDEDGNPRVKMETLRKNGGGAPDTE